MELILAAMVLSVLVGIPLGGRPSARRGSPTGRLRLRDAGKASGLRFALSIFLFFFQLAGRRPIGQLI
jgi:hypothetical protein